MNHWSPHRTLSTTLHSTDTSVLYQVHHDTEFWILNTTCAPWLIISWRHLILIQRIVASGAIRLCCGCFFTLFILFEINIWNLLRGNTVSFSFWVLMNPGGFPYFVFIWNKHILLPRKISFGSLLEKDTTSFDFWWVDLRDGSRSNI